MKKWLIAIISAIIVVVLAFLLPQSRRFLKHLWDVLNAPFMVSFLLFLTGAILLVLFSRKIMGLHNGIAGPNKKKVTLRWNFAIITLFVVATVCAFYGHFTNNIVSATSSKPGKEIDIVKLQKHVADSINKVWTNKQPGMTTVVSDNYQQQFDSLAKYCAEITDTCQKQASRFKLLEQQNRLFIQQHVKDSVSLNNALALVAVLRPGQHVVSEGKKKSRGKLSKGKREPVCKNSEPGLTRGSY